MYFKQRDPLISRMRTRRQPTYESVSRCGDVANDIWLQVLGGKTVDIHLSLLASSAKQTTRTAVRCSRTRELEDDRINIRI